MRLNPLHCVDSYKLGHMAQYPEGTQFVYSNLTARSGAHFDIPKEYDDGQISWFGLQPALIEFLNIWKEGFFDKDFYLVAETFLKRIRSFIGGNTFDIEKLRQLHHLGYIPLQIRALPEGSRVPYRVPLMTIVNTQEDFYWLTNYVETWLSAETWKGTTSASIAFVYRRILEDAARKTGIALEFVDWQGHDFSMRGMPNLLDAAKSGAAHRTVFRGTDNLLADDFIDEYYPHAADMPPGGSVPATEHSVMCMGGEANELETIKRLITEVYPNGNISVVCDTWDFWNVITDTTVKLKPLILARGEDEFGNSRVIFRPDSGDPVKILCGYEEDEIIRTTHGIVVKASRAIRGGEYCEDIITEDEVKGAVQCLWDIFGGTFTEKGYKILCSKVGLIYGDSITMSRALDIVKRLERKGFASCNSVLGIGSYTYQYVTRDTLGLAVKATWGQVKGVPRNLIKTPKTDNGVKKSATGLLRVTQQEDGRYVLVEACKNVSIDTKLRIVYSNGQMYTESFEAIQERVAIALKRASLV